MMKSLPHPHALIIFGSGGHGAVVLDCALSSGWKVNGFADETKPAGGHINGIRLIGGQEIFDDAERMKNCEFIVAIGNQTARERICLKIVKLGGKLATVQHAVTWISPFAKVAIGTVVNAGTIINTRATIGRWCILNTGCSIDHDCILEDGVQIAPGARLAGNVFCGKRSFIGTGAVVNPGIKIGSRAVIGSGAVVTRDIPEDHTVVGIPARQMRAISS